MARVWLQSCRVTYGCACSWRRRQLIQRPSAGAAMQYRFSASRPRYRLSIVYLLQYHVACLVGLMLLSCSLLYTTKGQRDILQVTACMRVRGRGKCPFGLDSLPVQPCACLSVPAGSQRDQVTASTRARIRASRGSCHVGCGPSPAQLGACMSVPASSRGTK